MMSFQRKNTHTYQSKKNIIAGRNPVVEALRNQEKVDKILLYKNASGDAIAEIRKLAQDLKIPVQYVPNEKLRSITNINHQGVVAFKSAITYFDLQQVIDWLNDQGQTPLLLMLDGVTDVRNIGAIARTAVCTGVAAIIIPDRGVAALTEDAIKSSAGALEKIHICRVQNLADARETLQLNGIKLFVAEMNATLNISEINFKDPCCIVMGDEGKGVHPLLEQAADASFSISMKSNFDSYNVSVACGITLYEALKQRL